MKILFFTYDIPYPLNSGGKIRAYFLLREIAKHHQVYLFSFYREEKQLADLVKLKNICVNIYPFKRRKVGNIFNFLCSLRLPFPAALYFDPQIKEKIYEVVKDKEIDLIHFESFYTSVYLNKSLKIPQVLGTENIEWRIYENYLLRQKNILVSSLMRWEIERIKRFEFESWKKADVVFSVSEENSLEIEKITAKKSPVIANGMEQVLLEEKSKNDDLNLLFVGNLSYIQNQDGVDWLLSEIWPKIKSKIKSKKLIKLIIAGKGASNYLKKINDADVKIYDDLDDLRKLYQSATLVIASLRIGSGTKFKILEAMAYGVPVVTTPLGAEGIESLPQWGLIAENSEKLAEAVVALTADQEKREEMGRNGRFLVGKYYGWKDIGEKIYSEYEKIINNYR